MLRKIISFVRTTLKGLERSSISHGEKRTPPGADQPASPPPAASVPASVPEAAQPASGKTPAIQGKYRRPKPAKPAARDSWDLSAFEVVPVEGKSRFHDFDLPVSIMHAIADLGFQYCTPIQANTLAGTLSGVDAIGQAQTGTGKTAAFLISVLTRLLSGAAGQERTVGRPRALVIAPTRELVIQIAKDGEALAKYCGLRIAAVFGGVDYERQQQALERDPVDILVATPGRLLDFQRRKVVDLSRVEVMVIDEADRMLDMGFIPDVRKIVYSTPPKEKRQTLMFSATMTPDVRHLASQWCVNPINVEVEAEHVAVDTVRQIVYLATASEKYDILYNMIKGQNLDKVLVFTNRRDETQRLTDRLTSNGISCDMLSGDVAQKKRMTTLERFRGGQIKVLVATDVAGRGIHIDGITHVVNYTLPYEAEDYVHRIGRTGRAGNAGIAISFADEDGAFYLPPIEAYIGRKLDCVQPEDELLVPAPKGTSKPREKSRPNAPQDARRPGGHRRSSSARPRRPTRPRSSAQSGN